MYISLHTHTTYSLKDAVGRVGTFVELASKLGMSAIAVTEHGNIKSWPELNKYCKKYNIKPIYGLEAYFVDDIEEKPITGSRNYSHIILLAQNSIGYKNIVKLTSLSYMDGFYYKPRIDKNMLSKYCEGIIILSACAGGVLAKPLIEFGEEAAEERLQWFVNIVGNKFFLELQQHDTCADSELKIINPWLIKMAEKYHLDLVTTNDVHYPNAEDYKAHQVILCDAHNVKLTNIDYKYFYDKSFYFKNEDEMEKLFPNNLEAVHNSGKIADMIELFDPELSEYNFPQAQCRELDVNCWLTEEQALEEIKNITYKKLSSLNPPNIQEYQTRLDYELSVIKDFKFGNYLLVMSDALTWCRNNDIYTGPGRGSAVNCLTNYLLDITALDPIIYQLEFSRFLNKGRLRVDANGHVIYSSMIDVDCDISQDGRQKFLEYLKNKYPYVYHMGTDTRYSCKTAIKTAARAMGIEFFIMNDFSKLLQERQPGTDTLVSIEDNLKRDVVTEFIKKHKLEQVVELAKGLEGGLAGEGVHASGIVISQKSLEDLVPLRPNQTSPLTTIGFNMKEVESFAKQIKFDFLGLRNLSVVNDAERLIKTNYKNIIIPEWGDFTDDTVYQAKYGLDNVFQLGSGLAYSYYSKINPSNIGELCDLIALIRPGALTSGWADKYAEGGFTHKITAMNDLLKDTRGIMVYQEQLMHVAQVVGGFSAEKADDLRKACGKKHVEEMKVLLQEFEEQATIKGYKKSEIQYIIEQMMDNALYSFNKGHSIGYAAIAYKTLWLKHYYPTEFYCAVLNSVIGSSEDVKEVIRNITKYNIRIKTPDINKSHLNYTMGYDSKGAYILNGLLGVKNVGDKAANRIIKMRPFTSIEDFVAKVPRSCANSRVKTFLANGGAFDNIEADRNKSISWAMEQIVEYTDIELALMEKEALGFFFSSNPYLQHKCYSRVDLDMPMDIPDDLSSRTVSIVGFLDNVSIQTSKKSKQYMTGTITDGVESIMLLGFENIVNSYGSLAVRLSGQYNPVIISGKLTPDAISDEKELTLQNVKLNIYEITEWTHISGITNIRVPDPRFKDALEFLTSNQGTDEVVLTTPLGQEQLLKTNLNKEARWALNYTMNAKIRFKEYEDN